MINSHIKCHPNASEGVKDALLEEDMSTEATIPQDLLKKYILYAKKHIRPKLNDADTNKVTKFYTELRREASAVGGLPIGVRHIESIIRMAESHAKMHLRHVVIDADINIAIEMMLTSFLMSQKYAVAKGLERKFGPYLARGQPNGFSLRLLDRILQDKMRYVNANRMNGEQIEVHVSRIEFENEARNYQLENVADFFNSREFQSKYHLEGGYIKSNY